jgi:SAM-dependent methyltransferase
MLDHLKARLAGLRSRFRSRPAGPPSPPEVDESALIATLRRSPEESAIAIPPADIRYRVVSERLSAFDYLRVGVVAKTSIEHALSTAGITIDDVRTVLDWGCGCCRIMRHWAPQFGSTSFTGTDIDTAMIEWDRANVAGVRFAVNGAKPPLPCRDGEFELVYGVSVFTHLDESMQAAWLDELHRVLAPGGVLVLSTHGPSVFEQHRESFSAAEVAAFTERGFVYVRNIADGVLPDWYQTSFQTRAHVERTFGRRFDVVDHLDRGMADFQDLVICRKPAQEGQGRFG